MQPSWISLAQGLSQGCSHLKVQVGEDLYPNSRAWLLARFSVSQVGAQRALVPCWLLARLLPQLLARWAFPWDSSHDNSWHLLERVKKRPRESPNPLFLRRYTCDIL